MLLLVVSVNQNNTKMKRIRFAAAALIALAALATSCDPDKKTDQKPGPDPLNPDEVALTEATSVAYFGETEGVYNYYVCLSSTPIESDEEGYPIPSDGGIMVLLDMYSSEDVADWDNATLPEGVYELQSADEGIDDGKLSLDYTLFSRNTDGEVSLLGLEYCEITVSNKGGKYTISGALLTDEEEEVEFRYVGELEIEDASNSGNDAIPSIDEPVNTVMTEAEGLYYGDLYETGTDNYEMHFLNAEVDEEGYVIGEGYEANISFFTEISGEIALAAGTYTIDYSYEAGTLEPGELVWDIFPVGTYVIKYCADGSVQYAFVSEGTVKVENSGSTYTVTADLVADNGVSLKYSYTGEVTFEDLTLEDGDGDYDDYSLSAVRKAAQAHKVSAKKLHEKKAAFAHRTTRRNSSIVSKAHISVI